MANIIRGKGGEAGERTRSRNHVYQEFVPSAAWSEDSNSHYLLVDLPGIHFSSFSDSTCLSWCTVVLCIDVKCFATFRF